MVLVGCNVQDLYVTYKFHEEVPMGVNQTVRIFMGYNVLLGQWKLQGWVGGIVLGEEGVLVP